METESNENHQHVPLAPAPLPTLGPPQPAEFCSPAIMKLAGALAKAQAGFEAIERTRTVTVRPRPKDGREFAPYTFSYAPLDVVLTATVPALAANGLSLVSLPMDGGDRLRTLLMHESGEWMAVEVFMPKFDGPQAFGSAMTYMRRYSIVALLGVASEEDDDGNAAEGNRIEASSERPRGNNARAPQPSAAPPARPNGAPPAPKAPTPSAPSPSTPPAAAADSTEPLMTDGQEKAANALFTKLKIGRSAAGAYVKDLFGKTSGLSVKQGDELVASLEARIAELTGGAP